MRFFRGSMEEAMGFVRGSMEEELFRLSPSRFATSQLRAAVGEEVCRGRWRVDGARRSPSTRVRTMTPPVLQYLPASNAIV